MRDLEAFFNASRGVCFGWKDGRRDCLTLPADWVVWCGLPDPAGPWRGRYRDERGAWALVDAAGGMEAIVDEGMRLADGTRLDDPNAAVSGDIGVVRLVIHSAWAQPARSVHTCGAIRAGAFWAVQAAIGVTIGEAEALAAWRF